LRSVKRFRKGETNLAEATKTIEFTGRQRDILALAAAGQGPKDMARTLKISIRTVTVHLQGVYALLELKGYGSLLKMQEWAKKNGY
jgi:DNA-binding CsgD family transcriptional regulator